MISVTENLYLNEKAAINYCNNLLTAKLRNATPLQAQRYKMGRILSKRKNIRCATPFCKNKVKHGTICGSCVNRKYRLNNPMRYAYMTLRDNSKRRGKYNDLTFEEFKDFCYEYDYISGKGKTKTSYSIDCIDEKKGYTRTNIRVLSLRNNSLKRWKKLEYDWETKSVAIVKNYTTQHNTTQHNTTTNPF